MVMCIATNIMGNKKGVRPAHRIPPTFAFLANWCLGAVRAIPDNVLANASVPQRYTFFEITDAISQDN